jgi:serine/threonine protein kinase
MFDGANFFPIGKITDFGLASVLGPTGVEVNSMETAAVRWTAPEMARLMVDSGSKEKYPQKKNFLEKADVWSFAMTALEVRFLIDSQVGIWDLTLWVPFKIVTDQDPFPEYENEFRSFAALSRQPSPVTEYLPRMNPVPEILSDNAFNCIKMCWELDHTKRPTMVSVATSYANEEGFYT